MRDADPHSHVDLRGHSRDKLKIYLRYHAPNAYGEHKKLGRVVTHNEEFTFHKVTDPLMWS